MDKGAWWAIAHGVARVRHKLVTNYYQDMFYMHNFNKWIECRGFGWSHGSVQFSSVAQSCPTLCSSMNYSTPGLPAHHHLLEFTQTQRPSSWWCHPAISSSVVPFSPCPQFLPASESFPMSQLFAWGGQSTGASALASFLPKNTQGWSPLEDLIGLTVGSANKASKQLQTLIERLHV